MEREIMFKDPFGWFPDPLFTNLFPILVIAVFFIDYMIPRLADSRGGKPAMQSDKGSFTVISIATVLGSVAGIILRFLNIGLSTTLVQWIGMGITIIGLGLREWALIKLGRFFSRTIQIETEHKIIHDGPYKWIRHPAYTGMILIYAGFILSIGTWIGAIVTTLIVTISLFYRIKIEEKILLEAFGNEYREYMSKTWRLFPGW